MTRLARPLDRNRVVVLQDLFQAEPAPRLNFPRRPRRVNRVGPLTRASALAIARSANGRSGVRLARRRPHRESAEQLAEQGGEQQEEVEDREGEEPLGVGPLGAARQPDGSPLSPRSGGGWGRAIVEALARELGGYVEWSFASCGTTVVLSIPSKAQFHAMDWLQAAPHIAELVINPVCRRRRWYARNRADPIPR